MANDRGLVSVVVPVRNRPDRVLRALRSVARQGYPRTETIVVDDGSTDDTPEAVESAAPGGGVTLLRHRTRKGAAAARNTGLRHASGRFVAFLDSDDEWKGGKLAAQVEALCERGDASCVATGSLVYDEALGRKVGERVPPLREVRREKILVADVIGATSAVMVRRSAIERAGARFDPSLPSRQDWDFWIQLLRAGPAVCLEEKLTVWWVSGDQISADLGRMVEGSERVIQKHRAEMEERGPAFGRLLGRLARWQLCLNGRDGWSTAREAARRAPWQPKLYAALALSLAGRPVYRTVFRKAYELAGRPYVAGSV